MIKRLKVLTYEERLKELNLPSRASRHPWQYMITIYKYMKGINLSSGDLWGQPWEIIWEEQT